MGLEVRYSNGGFMNLKVAGGHFGTLRLPQKLRRSGRTDSHPTGDDHDNPFVLNPELAEGSKHETG